MIKKRIRKEKYGNTVIKLEKYNKEIQCAIDENEWTTNTIKKRKSTGKSVHRVINIDAMYSEKQIRSVMYSVGYLPNHLPDKRFCIECHCSHSKYIYLNAHT